MLTPEEVKGLTARFVGQMRLPVDGVGDRLDVARDAIAATIRRLAPMVSLDELEPAPITAAGPPAAKSSEDSSRA